MNNIAELLQVVQQNTNAPHELADSVNYIIAAVGSTKRYNYGYWLSKVKRKGLTFFQVKQLVDKANGLDGKYNKGGFLSNQMK